VHFAFLLGAYLAWAGLAWAMVAVAAGTSTAVISGTGRPTVITHSRATLYQSQPGTVRLILTGLAIAVLISTASVIWRIVRRSTRLGITGIVVAGLVGVAALLGVLTIGLFIVPLAAFLVVLALPITPNGEWPTDNQGSVPAGWYGDPDQNGLWRYWDGQNWTAGTAPTVVPESSA